jgi:hypothetical protein
MHQSPWQIRPALTTPGESPLVMVVMLAVEVVVASDRLTKGVQRPRKQPSPVSRILGSAGGIKLTMEVGVVFSMMSGTVTVVRLAVVFSMMLVPVMVVRLAVEVTVAPDAGGMLGVAKKVLGRQTGLVIVEAPFAVTVVVKVTIYLESVSITSCSVQEHSPPSR